jgi:hypothetical protein
LETGGFQAFLAENALPNFFRQFLETRGDYDFYLNILEKRTVGAVAGKAGAGFGPFFRICPKVEFVGAALRGAPNYVRGGGHSEGRP